MSFPVDMLNTCSHEDLESSAEGYLSDLRHQDPNHSEFLSLPDHGKVIIKLGTVGFVPLYGEEQTHKVLGLFAPRDSLTAVALYLANQWWSVDDILRTSVTTRQGLHKVESVGERIVLYVLNRIIYRTQEMERNEIPFLCHSSNDYAKIMWKKGEAVGFYSVKPKGSICSSSRGQSYKLSVLDTMFVRKKHRERESGLIMLEDFVDSFREATLGLRYPLSSFMFTACKLYLEKYPEDHNLLWEVEGAGYWFQKTSIMSTLQSEKLKTASMDTFLGVLVIQPLVFSINCPFGCFHTPLLPPPQALNINDSEMLTKESTVVEKEGTEEQQESEKMTTENAAASTSKEEPSNNGLPNPMVTEAAEESVSENVLPEVASSLEDQDEEADHNSQEAPIALSQSSLIVVELEGFSFQQPSGQEGQKNQLEEHSEEPPEQMDQHQQTAAERAADSSSEEAEVEIPIVDRRNLRRKAKCSKGPPKKKGKPA
uniref:Family with sequence similarity 169 member A n=1 Tax=Bubo bubo TaxID=30461 RepID=A0A8C0E9N8_BUBBB